jgi:invasion protein IalB
MKSIAFLLQISMMLLAAGGVSGAATLAPPPQTPIPAATAKPQTAQNAEQAEPAADPKNPKGPGWVSKCISESRNGPAECSIEETLAVASSGQPVASVTIRIRPDDRQPIMTVRLPVGLYLPAGLNVHVDDGKEQALSLQTCDLQGCYGETQVGQNLISALKSGKRLSLTFQNMAKTNVLLPLPLDNFADAFQKIQ